MNNVDTWVEERRREILKLHKKVPNWRDQYFDLSFWDNFFSHIEKRQLENPLPETDEAFEKTYASLARTHVTKNMNIVFNMAESPIETLLLSQIVVVFALYDPFSLIVPEHNFREQWNMVCQNRQEVLNIHKETGGSLAEIEGELLNKNEWTLQLVLPVIHAASGEFDWVFMVPQAVFDKSVVETMPELKGVVPTRPDISFGKLNDKGYPDCRLIVECDGFEYHKDKNAFTRDRQKDRIWKTAGVDVLRFSGREIHESPENCALDIFDFIRKSWDFSFFFIEETESE